MRLTKISQSIKVTFCKLFDLTGDEILQLLSFEQTLDFNESEAV